MDFLFVLFKPMCGSPATTAALEREYIACAAAEVRPPPPRAPPSAARICFIVRFGVPYLGAAGRPAPGGAGPRVCLYLVSSVLNRTAEYAGRREMLVPLSGSEKRWAAFYANFPLSH